MSKYYELGLSQEHIQTHY